MDKIRLWNIGTRPVICSRRFHRVIQPRRSELVSRDVADDLLKLDFITDKDPAIPEKPKAAKKKDTDGSNDNTD